MTFGLIQPLTPETPVSSALADAQKPSQRAKFSDPYVTSKGAPRASVPFLGYRTLWFNTGTLCNLSCQNCYIESSPRNDRLVFLTRNEVRQFLDEARSLPDAPAEIGFTGGEPFMNPDIVGMLEDSLAYGFRVLVLTNAMKPMQRRTPALLETRSAFLAACASAYRSTTTRLKSTKDCVDLALGSRRSMG